MKIELLNDLLDQYLAGTLSSEGKTELGKLIDDPAYRPALESLLEQSFQEGSFKGEESVEIRNAVQEWLHEKINDRQAEPRLKKPVIFRIVRFAAAACIIGLAGLAIWFLGFKNNRAGDKKVQGSELADFAPGREGAILTLADGRQITLEAAANGALAIQGGVSVNKKDGQVLYEGKGGVLYNTMTTPKGRQYTVVLADNSKIVLNAASSIRFPTSFPGNERVVEVTGEAYFEVAKDATKKFIVIAGDMRTEVLGTHFTINSYTDEERITATLLEGNIKVSDAKQTSLLQPGGQVQISRDGGFTTIKNANIEEATGWINGYFYFEKANVETVMRQLVRWYDIDVQYKGDVTKEFFGGKIQRNLNLSSVMEILKTIGVMYKVEGKTVIIGS